MAACHFIYGPATQYADDPGIGGINLAYEYNVAAPKAGSWQEQVWWAQLNGLEASFLTVGEKKGLFTTKGSKVHQGRAHEGKMEKE